MTAAHKAEEPRLQPEPFGNQHHNVVDFPTLHDSSKALTTLKAKFALAGHQVHEGSNDDFIVTRWGMSRYCAGHDELRRFARVLGLNHG